MRPQTLDQPTVYNQIVTAKKNGDRLFAILIDPENTLPENIPQLVKKLPPFTTHLLVGGSTATKQQTQLCTEALKKNSDLAVILFPGNHTQINAAADALLFLSLLSGRNPEYLIGQQVKATAYLKTLSLEIIPTGYLLIDGGSKTSVELTSGTTPLPAAGVENVVNTALAGQYSGKKLIYLEAGSGAKNPIPPSLIKTVCRAVNLPVIVGGGVKTLKQMEEIYAAGATLVVVGTAFEKDMF